MVRVGVVAFVVLAATACYPRPLTNRVVAVGDSLTVGAEWAGLSTLLRERGFDPTVDAEVGRRADQAISIVDTLTEGRSGTLLIGLGTNDGPDLASFRRDVDAIMGAAHGWPVVWALVESGPALPVNAVLREATERYPNLRLVDFSPIVTANPSYRTSDGIHLTYAGYEARATFLAEQCQRP